MLKKWNARRIVQMVVRRIKFWLCPYIVFKNIFHTHYSKKCLMLYIVQPFINHQTNSHVNQRHALAMAQIFHDKGFDVDVAQYNIKRDIDFRKYDVIFGFGEQFDKCLERKYDYSGKFSYTTIAFLTGASPYYSNVAELKRLAYFKKRNGAALMLRRQVHESDGLMNLAALQKSTAGICIGNDWTMRTWEHMVSNVHKITATGFDNVKLRDIKRKIGDAKKNFLYFSGAGCIHKGLDLCIEAFRKMPTLNLYIAGAMDSDFYNFYRNDLEGKNIHYKGFLDVTSGEYRELCESCLFAIFPSCSEGMASSVLTTMFSGMIPIVTEESGVDIEDWGIAIKHPEVHYLATLIREASVMNDEDLGLREEKAYRYALENHSMERFQTDFSRIVDLILSAS